MGELIAKLGVDWKLLIAQMVNFGILVAALSALVYKPLLKLIDERAAKIKKSLDDADRIAKQNKELDALHTEQLKKMDAEAGEFLERAKKQAEATKAEILEGAKREADSIMERSRQKIEAERSEMMAVAQKQLATLIVSLTEKVLAREFTDADQKRITENLGKDIPSLLKK